MVDETLLDDDIFTLGERIGADAAPSGEDAGADAPRRVATLSLKKQDEDDAIASVAAQQQGNAPLVAVANHGQNTTIYWDGSGMIDLAALFTGDDDGGTITYTFKNALNLSVLPTGITASANGLISVARNVTPGDYQIVVEAQETFNGVEGEAVTSGIINIIVGRSAPLEAVAHGQDVVVTEGDSATILLDAFFTGDDGFEDVVTYELKSRGSTFGGISLTSSTAKTLIIPDDAVVGDYTFFLVATESVNGVPRSGTNSANFRVVIVPEAERNNPLVPVTNHGQDVVITQGDNATISFAALFTGDDEGFSDLSIEYTFSRNTLEFINGGRASLPPGMMISATGEVTTTNDINSGRYILSVRGVEIYKGIASSPVVSNSITINVEVNLNLIPVINHGQDVEISAGTTGMIDLAALFTNLGGVPIVYTLIDGADDGDTTTVEEIPDGLTLSVSDTGQGVITLTRDVSPSVYHLRVRGEKTVGGETLTNESNNITITIASNEAPRVDDNFDIPPLVSIFNNLSSGIVTYKRATAIDISGYFMDAERDALTYELVSVTNPSGNMQDGFTLTTGGELTATLGLVAGVYRFTIRVDDDTTDTRDAVETTLDITSNRSPNLVGDSPTPLPIRINADSLGTDHPINRAFEIDLDDYFEDADGIASFAARFNGSGGTLTLDSTTNILRLTQTTGATLTDGTITVTARDPSGVATIVDINFTLGAGENPAPTALSTVTDSDALTLIDQLAALRIGRDVTVSAETLKGFFAAFDTGETPGFTLTSDSSDITISGDATRGFTITPDDNIASGTTGMITIQASDGLAFNEDKPTYILDFAYTGPSVSTVASAGPLAAGLMIPENGEITITRAQIESLFIDDQDLSELTFSTVARNPANVGTINTDHSVVVNMAANGDVVLAFTELRLDSATVGVLVLTAIDADGHSVSREFDYTAHADIPLYTPPALDEGVAPFAYLGFDNRFDFDVSNSFTASAPLTYTIMGFDADGQGPMSLVEGTAVNPNAALDAFTTAVPDFDVSKNGVLTGTLPADVDYAITVRAADAFGNHVDYTFSLRDQSFYDYSAKPEAIIGTSGVDTLTAAQSADAGGHVYYLQAGGDSRVASLSAEGNGSVDTFIFYVTLFNRGSEYVIAGKSISSQGRETYGSTISDGTGGDRTSDEIATAAATAAAADNRNFEIGIDRIVLVVTNPENATGRDTDFIRHEVLSKTSIIVSERGDADDGRVKLQIFGLDATAEFELIGAHIDDESKINDLSSHPTAGFTISGMPAEIIDLFGVGNFVVLLADEFVAPNVVSFDYTSGTTATTDVVHESTTTIDLGSRFITTANAAAIAFTVTSITSITSSGGTALTSDFAIDASTGVVTISDNMFAGATYRVVYTVDVDGTGAGAAETITSDIILTLAPHLTQVLPSAIAHPANRVFTLDLSEYFGDADVAGSDKLSFRASVAPSFTGDVAVSGSILTITPSDDMTPLTAGTITLTARDKHGANTAQDINFTVIAFNDPIVALPATEGVLSLADITDSTNAAYAADVVEFLRNFDSLVAGESFSVTDATLAKLFTGISTAELTAAANAATAEQQKLFEIVTNDTTTDMSIPFTVAAASASGTVTYTITAAATGVKLDAGDVTVTAHEGIEFIVDMASQTAVSFLFNSLPVFDADGMGTTDFTNLPETAFAAPFDVSSLFTDADSDTLTYTIISVNGTDVGDANRASHSFGGITFTGGNTASFDATTPLSGNYNIIVAASDDTDPSRDARGAIEIAIFDPALPVAGTHTPPKTGAITLADTVLGTGRAGNYVYTDDADAINFYIARGGIADGTAAPVGTSFVVASGMARTIVGDYGTLTITENTDGNLRWSYIADIQAHQADQTETFTVRITDVRTIDHADSATYHQQTISVGIAEGAATFVSNTPEAGEIVVPLVAPSDAPPEDVSPEGFQITGDGGATGAQVIVADQAPDVIRTGTGTDTIDAGRGIDRIALATDAVADKILYTIDTTSTSWVAYDGADTVNDFVRGVDVLIFKLLALNVVVEANAAAGAEAYYNVNAAIRGVDLRPIYSVDGTMVSGIELGFGVSGGSYGGIATGNVLTINFAAELATAEYDGLDGLSEILGGTESVDVFDVNFETFATNNVAELARGSGFIDAIAVARVGVDISVDLSQISDTDGLTQAQMSNNSGFSYQWVRLDSVGLGADIPDFAFSELATTATHTPDAANIGDFIRVIVSFRDDAGNAESVSSDAVRIIPALDDDAPPPAPDFYESDSALDNFANGADII